ncbi:hypothetical protein IFM89_015347 [Coptis chinensis]|uniref:Uncharacterized protein n=1 Tax=Coptis chinensis TaxID=261450 RepID=A0A835M6E4_9MAGN|nr:hypothetical protein IFM89_015347 [Coptis chinensis]
MGICLGKHSQKHENSAAFNDVKPTVNSNTSEAPDVRREVRILQARLDIKPSTDSACCFASCEHKPYCNIGTRVLIKLDVVVVEGLELKFNTTYSYLQLGQDGNLRIYTYFDKVNDTTTRPPWDETLIYNVL